MPTAAAEIPAARRAGPEGESPHAPKVPTRGGDPGPDEAGVLVCSTGTEREVFAPEERGMKLGTKIAILLGALEVVVLAVLGVLDLARDEAFFFSDTKRDQAIVAVNQLLDGLTER